jgi:hypothetical protein
VLPAETPLALLLIWSNGLGKLGPFTAGGGGGGSLQGRGGDGNISVVGLRVLLLLMMMMVVMMTHRSCGQSPKTKSSRWHR